MFYGKKIKELEENVQDLEMRVHELVHKMKEQCAEVDKLFLMFEQQATANVQKPKPKYRPKKHNGKETPKATE